jgi:hypothetical protein
MNREQELQEQIALGRSLLGKYVRFWHLPEGPSCLVVHVTAEGMVELRGFVGQFAPHIFATVDCSHEDSV